jgi:heptaprenyl diphosphate synthase
MRGADITVPASPGPAESPGPPHTEHLFWHDIPEVHGDLDRVRATVLAEAASAGGEIGRALAEYAGRSGKLLRPGFVLIGAWAGPARRRGPASARLIQIAAAIETLHIATLIHDDVIDDADSRRGEPSLHALHGRKRAVLMGDYLLSRCFSMIAGGTSRTNALRLAAATGHLVRGEIGQLHDVSSDCFSRRSYLRRIAGKTAMLFGLSLVTGATENKANPREVFLLQRIGYSLGMAFQVIDDILDLTSQRESLGKPAASDLQSGIYTLPVIEAAIRDPSVRDLVLPPPAPSPAYDAAVAAVIRAGGVSRAGRYAAAYTARAHRAIERLATERQREALALVANRLLDRTY